MIKFTTVTSRPTKCWTFLYYGLPFCIIMYMSYKLVNMAKFFTATWYVGFLFGVLSPISIVWCFSDSRNLQVFFEIVSCKWPWKIDYCDKVIWMCTDGDLVTIFDSSDLTYAIHCSKTLKLTLFGKYIHTLTKLLLDIYLVF